MADAGAKAYSGLVRRADPGRPVSAPRMVPRGARQVRDVSLPPGCWPAEMRAATAAAYVDEPSIDAFLAKVDRGLYHAPARLKGMLPKWNREKLDLDVRRRHNLRTDGGRVVEDISDAF